MPTIRASCSTCCNSRTNILQYVVYDTSYTTYLAIEGGMRHDLRSPALDRSGLDCGCSVLGVDCVPTETCCANATNRVTTDGNITAHYGGNADLFFTAACCTSRFAILARLIGCGAGGHRADNCRSGGCNGSESISRPELERTADHQSGPRASSEWSLRLRAAPDLYGTARIGDGHSHWLRTRPQSTCLATVAAWLLAKIAGRGRPFVPTVWG